MTDGRGGGRGREGGREGGKGGRGKGEGEGGPESYAQGRSNKTARVFLPSLKDLCSKSAEGMYSQGSPSKIQGSEPQD